MKFTDDQIKSGQDALSDGNLLKPYFPALARMMEAILNQPKEVTGFIEGIKDNNPN